MEGGSGDRRPATRPGWLCALQSRARAEFARPAALPRSGWQHSGDRHGPLSELHAGGGNCLDSAAGGDGGRRDYGQEETAMIAPEYYIFLGSGLFTIGVIGVLTRRNILIILMSIELILNRSEEHTSELQSLRHL